METKGQKTGFWSQGFSIFKDDLARKEEAMIAPLKKEMRETGDAARTLQLRSRRSRMSSGSGGGTPGTACS